MIPSPHHPGKFLQQLLDEHSISQSTLARHIRVQIGVINQICNEKRGISASMAHKLARAFRMTPEFWLHLQVAFELGREDKDDTSGIKPIIRVA